MRKIIIDCDPGVDDAIAIFLALASAPEIEVLGLTCVKGNVSLAKTYANARKLCALAGRPDIPVLSGVSRPLMDPKGIETWVHGVDGLGDIGLPVPTGAAHSQHAVDFIIEQVNRYPGEVVLCPIGPMTNVALALLRDEGLAAKLHSIVFMGGAAFVPGNMNDHAEFNFLVDPHAAAIALQAQTPQVMFGLDVTLKAPITPAFLAALQVMPNACAKVSAQLLAAYAVGDLHLHDPCVIAWLIDPSLFSGVQAQVHVLADAGPQAGRSVATRDAQGGCLVMTDVDHPRLEEMLLLRLGQLP